MKKCKKCGALQSDDKSVCIDCGAHLGRAMTPLEEEAAEAALDDKLDNMAERAEDFYVPLRDKIMGALCIVGIIAAIVLIVLVGRANDDIRQAIPDNVIVNTSNGFTEILSDGEGNYDYPHARVDELSRATLSAVIGIICLVAAFPMLIIPKFMWLLDTLKYRIFYGWDTTPSYFAIVIRKVVTYILFGVGVIAVIGGWYMYL